MNYIQQQNQRKEITMVVILVFITCGVYTLFDIIFSITHNGIFWWLGLIAMPIGLLPGVVILIRLMRRQQREREAKQQSEKRRTVK